MELIEGVDLETIAGSDEMIGELGAIARNNPQRAKKVLQNANAKTQRKSYTAGRKEGKHEGRTSVISSSMTGRAWFELKVKELPDKVKEGFRVAPGKTQADNQCVDAILYAVKDISKQSVVSLFTPSDDKKVGVSNVNGAKLDSGDYFLVTAIAIDFGTFDKAGGALPSTAKFSDDYPAKIINGELEFKVGATSLIPDNFSMEAFNNETITTKRPHIYVLDNPKWIYPQLEIKPKLSMVEAGEDGEAIKITLFGVKVAPNTLNN